MKKKLRSTLCVFVLLTMCCGCLHGRADEGIPTPPIPIPVDPVIENTPAIALTVAPDSYAEIISWIGGSNSLSLEKPHKINHSEIGLDLAAGTNVSWVSGPEKTTFTLSPPPKITSSAIAKVLGLKLYSLDVLPDGSGTATVSGGIHRGFYWKNPASSAATESLPKVYWWGNLDTCGYCRQANSDFMGAKDLPFQPVHMDEPRPTWMPRSDPNFWWHVSENEPTQEDVKNTRHEDGYPGLKTFLAKFNKSRTKKTSHAESISHGSASAVWTFPGNSSIDLRRHLMSGQHAGKFSSKQLSEMNYHQLERLHSADHEGKVFVKSSNQSCPTCPTGTQSRGGYTRQKSFLGFTWN